MMSTKLTKLSKLTSGLNSSIQRQFGLLTATQLQTGRALQMARRVMRPFVDEMRIEARLIDATLRRSFTESRLRT